MRIDGAWEFCIDEVIRPVVRAEVIAADGTPVVTLFLVDTGADRTVLSSDILDQLGLPLLLPSRPIESVGGVAASVDVQAEIRFYRHEGGQASFSIRCSAVTDPAALDMSVLGRDVIDYFALIVDRPSNTSCLLNQRHRYAITMA